MRTDQQPKPSLDALEALKQEFVRLAADDASNGRVRGAAWRTRVLAPAVGVIAILCAAALTPPGRAVAERVGELVGLVDDNGAVVIGEGETPQDRHPYVVEASGEPDPGETCIFLRFREVDGAGFGSCLAGDVPRDLTREKLSPFVYWPPRGLLPQGSAVLQGLAVPEAARVEVTYREADGSEVAVPVDLSDLSPDLLRRARLADGPTRFFVAFLPPEALRGATFESDVGVPAVEIEAFDSNGSKLATRSLSELRDYETTFDRRRAE